MNIKSETRPTRRAARSMRYCMKRSPAALRSSDLFTRRISASGLDHLQLRLEPQPYKPADHLTFDRIALSPASVSLTTVLWSLPWISIQPC